MKMWQVYRKIKAVWIPSGPPLPEGEARAAVARAKAAIGSIKSNRTACRCNGEISDYLRKRRRDRPALDRVGRG